MGGRIWLRSHFVGYGHNLRPIEILQDITNIHYVGINISFCYSL